MADYCLGTWLWDEDPEAVSIFYKVSCAGTFIAYVEDLGGYVECQAISCHTRSSNRIYVTVNGEEYVIKNMYAWPHQECRKIIVVSCTDPNMETYFLNSSWSTQIAPFYDKRSSAWEQGNAKVKVNGEWKTAGYGWTKVNGVWRRTL